MKLIISPAKKMRVDTDSLPPRGTPVYLENARRLADHLRTLSFPELKKLLGCNDAIAQQNFARYQAMDLEKSLTPAILSYDGIQYQYMAPSVFSAGQFAYIEEHLRILSGLYGILRPFDGVTPYRLEMCAKLKTEFCDSLYTYWGASLAEALEGGAVLDLASEEYSRAVRPHLGEGRRYVRAVFGELIGGKVVEKGVYVKMARGEMVRFLAERGAEEPEAAREFDRLGYVFCPERSDENGYVFLKQGS